MAFIPIADTNPLRYIKRPFVAWAIIAANIVIYFTFELGGFAREASEASVINFGLIPAVFNGDIAAPIKFPPFLTLVTYAFLHADFWHLAGNMIFLWVFADNVEDAFGHVRFIVFYLLCAAGAGYAFVLSDPASTGPVIGASGAIAGVVAAYFLLHPTAKIWILLFARIPIRLGAIWVLGFWIVFQFISAFSGGEDNVAWWSHVGGLVCGAALTLVLRRRGVKLFDRHPADVVVATPAVIPTAAGRPGVPLVPPPANEAKGPWG
ncbi:rhomboid family intramembrane serine protease [soil metagenome]